MSQICPILSNQNHIPRCKLDNPNKPTYEILEKYMNRCGQESENGEKKIKPTISIVGLLQVVRTVITTSTSVYTIGDTIS